jgi:hypothetical protein
MLCQQSDELKESFKEIDKKWSSLNASVKDYRDYLNKSGTFHKLNEEIELWTSQKTQIINHLEKSKNECKEIRESEFILTQIEQNIDEIKKFSETKIKSISELALKIYGSYFFQLNFKNLTQQIKNFE